MSEGCYDSMSCFAVFFSRGWTDGRAERWSGIFPYSKTRGSSPGAVTGGTDDGALLDMAGADKAVSMLFTPC